MWKHSLSDSEVDFFQSGMSLQQWNANKIQMRSTQSAFESPTYYEFQNKTIANVQKYCDGFASSDLPRKNFMGKGSLQEIWKKIY